MSLSTDDVVSPADHRTSQNVKYFVTELVCKALCLLCNDTTAVFCRPTYINILDFAP